MSRLNDYQMSFELAVKELIGRNPYEVARLAGANFFTEDSKLILSYYGQSVLISWGKKNITITVLNEATILPIAEQVLILHYLQKADGTLPISSWITFREVESGEFYWSAFTKRVNDPLVKFFGSDPNTLLKLAPKVGGEFYGEIGNTSIIVRAFPFVNFLLVLWSGDDEFLPEGNVLMDKNICHYLSTEDIAFAASLPIYKMIASIRKIP